MPFDDCPASKKRYPALFSVKLYFVNEEGTAAQATWDFPVSQPPTEENIADAVSCIMESLPDGFRPMTHEETIMHFLRTEKGYRGPNISPDPCDGTWIDISTLTIEREKNDDNISD